VAVLAELGLLASVLARGAPLDGLAPSALPVLEQIPDSSALLFSDYQDVVMRPPRACSSARAATSRSATRSSWPSHSRAMRRSTPRRPTTRARAARTSAGISSPRAG
jgi:hypothetical protein